MTTARPVVAAIRGGGGPGGPDPAAPGPRRRRHGGDRVPGDAGLARWSVESNVEAAALWRPRAGYRFRGRTAVLAAVAEWLVRPIPDQRMLVATGSPERANPPCSAAWSPPPTRGRGSRCRPKTKTSKATVGPVACAVHARGKTALDVAMEIARAASVRLPRHPGDLHRALHRRLEERAEARFNIVIDALDEAAGPAQARQIIIDIVSPIPPHSPSRPASQRHSTPTSPSSLRRRAALARRVGHPGRPPRSGVDGLRGALRRSDPRRLRRHRRHGAPMGSQNRKATVGPPWPPRADPLCARCPWATAPSSPPSATTRCGYRIRSQVPSARPSPSAIER